MNREQIIQMAREADLIYWRPYANFKDGIWWMDEGEPDERLERFAKLVASAEREACAKRLDAVGCDHCATNIRARGQA